MSGHRPHSESSEEDEYENDAAMSEPQWQSQSQSTAISASSQPSRVAAPMQKRRRVTRACDECRKKKIKCDGKQPCTHCTVYSYECTYDQPSNRRRNPAPHYVEALETRLKRAEAFIKAYHPKVDLDDPHLDVGSPQRMDLSLKQDIQPLQPGQLRPWIPLKNVENGASAEKDPLLESMVTNTGTLDLDDDGKWDFHGHSSGRIFLRRMRDQFGDLMGKADSMPFMRYKSVSQPTESPRPLADTPMDPKLPRTHELPAKRCALLLSGNALDDAGAILRVVHQPSYYTMLHRIYDIPYEDFGDEEHKFLPLLYGVIALGTRFARSEQSELQTNGYSNAIDQGYHWHRVSRQMIDVTDCRDLTSLQTLLFMILFLQSSARLSTCYSYIGAAISSAIRMGLHRSVSNSFNPIERELRKRIFWIVRKLDIYVGALLGLPKMVSNDDIDQEMPMEVDDEYITIETVMPMPPGKLSLFASFNAHTRLVEILAKTMKYIYPIKGNENLHGKNAQSYVVSHAKIREIEQDLQAWKEALPMPFRPGEETSPEFTRIRHLLRMAYAHIQMFLYRPFLHYVSQTSQNKNIDKRSYACAAACVSVSRNIVQLTGDMKRRGLLVGSYWFYMYTTFFAIISLLFYVLENPHGSGAEDILKDAYEGKDTLAALAAKSLAADRCSQTLTELFDQLPSKLQQVRSSTNRIKRQTHSPQSGPQPQALHSAPDVSSGATTRTIHKNSMRKDSSSPIGQTSSARSPVPQTHSALRHQAVTSMDPNYQRGLHVQLSPTQSNSADIQTPTSPNGSFPTSAIPSVYGMQNAYFGQGVPDVSAMMFPSADPFVYPNQPMTTLENRNSIKQEHPMDVTMQNLINPTTTTNGQYKTMNTNIQSFSMPPYTMQGQPSSYTQGFEPAMTMSTGEPTTASILMQGTVPSQWSQQQPRAGMNYDQLFGEDWGGWMNYRQ